MDRRTGKAVRSRHCPATVMRNEAGIVPLPSRREGAGVGNVPIFYLSLAIIGHLSFVIYSRITNENGKGKMENE